MSDTEKLEKLEKFLKDSHESAATVIEEMEALEEENGSLEEHEANNVEQCDAVINITSQALDILNS